jgi:hypothetical protein
MLSASICQDFDALIQFVPEGAGDFTITADAIPRIRRHRRGHDSAKYHVPVCLGR